MNWWALGAGALYVGAAINSALHGNWYWAGMWFFYALANGMLFMAEMQR